jgi:hypothetical protein
MSDPVTLPSSWSKRQVLVRAADDVNQLSVSGQLRVQLFEPMNNVVYADWLNVSISGPFAITIDELPNTGVTSVSGGGNFSYWRFVDASRINDIVQALPDTLAQPVNISYLTLHLRTVSGGNVAISSTDYVHLALWTKRP